MTVTENKRYRNVLVVLILVLGIFLLFMRSSEEGRAKLIHKPLIERLVWTSIIAILLLIAFIFPPIWMISIWVKVGVLAYAAYKLYDVWIAKIENTVSGEPGNIPPLVPPNMKLNPDQMKMADGSSQDSGRSYPISIYTVMDGLT